MKIIQAIIVYSSVLITAHGYSQNICGPNLVPNHDFEINDPVLCGSSISGIGQLWIDTSQVVDWYGTSLKNGSGNGITPDHFNNNCTGNSGMACMQGNASVGVFTSTNAGTGTSNIREYVQCELNAPLVAGSTYYIQMTVSSGSGGSWAHTDGFGAWFRQDTAPIDIGNNGGTPWIPATPQFENQTGNIIDNNCQVISGYFCADGGENWLMLGNFKEDYQMTVGTSGGGVGSSAYVIVDEIFVQEVCPGSPPQLMDVIADQNPVSCGEDVTVEGVLLTTSYGTITYNWISPGSLSGSTNLGPHTETLTQNTNYAIEYTVNGACGNFTDTVSLGVTVNTGVNINLNTLVDETCLGDCDGSIDVSVSGGTPPYTNQWYDSGGNSLGSANNISALCSDDYTYEVTTTESVQQTNNIFSEDFESGLNGWTLNTNPTGGTNDANNNFWEINNDVVGPTVSSCTPSSDATLNLGCVSCSTFDTYDNINTSIMAESPMINTTAYTNLNLTFDFLAESNGTHAQGDLYYNDGGGWTFLASLNSATCWGSYNGWDYYSIALPASMNNIANAQIGFYWMNDTYIITEDWGMAINNINITGETPISVVCTEIDTFTISGTPCGCVPPSLSGTPQTVCSASYDLNNAITTSHANGAPNVTFYNSQTDADNATNGIGAIVSTTGTYYIRSEDPLDPSCFSTTSVTITFNPTPDAGTNGSTTLCSTDPSVDLFTLLGGTPDAGGTWSPALTSGTGVFDPAADAGGTYTYTVTNSCGTATADVVVTVTNSPNPGTNGSVTFCTSDAPADLFNSLGGTPDAGGTWSPALTSGTGMFDPATDAAGTYTYTLNACGGGTVTADVVVTVNPAPDAGTNGSTTLCSTDPSVDLFTLLGGTPDAGGTWSPALTSGTGVFDPAADAGGTYTYSVTNSFGTATADVAVTVTSSPNPGTNGSVTFCTSDAPADLFNSLGGTPDAGGTWSPALTSGTGMFDPATDAAGTYTYTLNACGGGTVTADVVVTVNPAPDAGTNGSTTLCSTDPSVDLFTLLGGTPDAGGTWSPAMTSGTGVFDPAVDAGGTYTYTVTNSCGTTTADVVVTVTSSPNPGTNGSVSFCTSDAPADLFNSLGGTPDAGGTWSPALTSGTGMFDPATDAAGTYTYTLNACGGGTVTADVVVTVNPAPDAGTNGSTTLCATDPSVDLFTLLGGTPDAGGTWSPALTSGTGVFDPATDAGGTYTYAVTNSCGTASANIVVNIDNCAPPQAEFTASSTLICLGECITLTDISTNNPDTWSWDFSGAATPDTSDLQNPVICPDTVGTFDVILTASNGYGDDTFTVSITVSPQPTVNAGADTTIEMNEFLDLIALGTPTGGTYNWWIGDTEICTDCQITTVNPLITTNYTVTYVSPAGCSASDDILVEVLFEDVIDVPSGFSPNGDDHNDILLVKGDGIQSMRFVVYNRYGQKIFESTSQQVGWDGTANGIPLNPGVLAWYLEYTLIDGTKNSKKGNVTLLK